ncbi:MAG: transcription termination/antitermination protein NusG [Pseudomonadota bacterium]
MALKWYIVHTYSGFEDKVKTALEERIATSGSGGDLFGQIIVPTENVVELVKGKRKTSSRRFYPGYVLVEMELNENTWHLVKNTPKVTGFLGGEDTPSPVPPEEVASIIGRMEAGKLKPQPKYSFEVGNEVRVVDGPFTNFTGVVDQIRPDKGKLRVMVGIFGRPTSVELDFVQVSKI